MLKRETYRRDGDQNWATAKPAQGATLVSRIKESSAVAAWARCSQLKTAIMI